MRCEKGEMVLQQVRQRLLNQNGKGVENGEARDGEKGVQLRSYAKKMAAAMLSGKLSPKVLAGHCGAAGVKKQHRAGYIQY
jgi:hypothetical protein